MKPRKKVRLNLYVRSDILDFAKKLSYVTGTPISGMLEEYLVRQKNLVASITPFQWLSDPLINPLASHEDNSLYDLEEYLNNDEEQEFCRQNPDHPRAKIRQQLLREYEQSMKREITVRKQKEKDLIMRWMEVFPVK